MKLNKFFFGLFVCASFCACSNDESELITGDVPKVFTGDEAYINVRLSDASSLTRATTTDPGYEYGTADEHSVKNAFFYFYDANGVFVSEGSAWNGGTASSGNPTNIEFTGKNVVVLKGLEKKNYPKYMVTVLNRPDNFVHGSTLNEMETVLTKSIYANLGEESAKKNYFIMSTTSWAGQKNEKNEAMKYFVTEVKEENFTLEPVDDDKNSDNYVTVYVERLAAKVTLKFDDNALKPVTITGKTGNYYVIKATVAGDGNVANDNVTAAEDLYVHFLGWKLNATANNSYMMKNIDESWSNEETGTLGFVWNKPSDFRSFWGKSFNYGKDGYPKNAEELYKTGSLVQNEYLTYVNLNSGLIDLGKDGYCAENTNTSEIVSANFPSAVTSILLKAEICDENGNPLDLVRFEGVLFKKDTFLKYIISVLNTKGNWNVWVKTTQAGATDETYEQLNSEYIELDNVSDGEVTVKLKSNTPTLYSKAEDGTFTAITDNTNIDTNLKTESEGAIGYTGGLMYYNIPIEHLNESNKDDTTGKYTGIEEANYGVVRNHHYVVTVNKLEKVGKGIFDEDEVIVPGDDSDKETYYVGANINILSWKIVSQTVGL